MVGSKVNTRLHTGCNCGGPGATLEPDLLLNSTFVVDYVANN